MVPCRPHRLIAICGLVLQCGHVVRGQEVPEIAVIRPDVEPRLSNAGWKYDRYQELPSLDAHSRVTVADLEGPGVIRTLHVTRHVPEELTSRGVVLEIWFDDAPEPAVHCPLADRATPMLPRVAPPAPADEQGK
jgi:hypothetical protein